MKVGDATGLTGNAEMEEEEAGGEEEERAEEVGGDEATGRTGVRKETGDVGDWMLRGTAPPAAEGLAALAAVGAEVGWLAVKA